MIPKNEATLSINIVGENEKYSEFRTVLAVNTVVSKEMPLADFRNEVIQKMIEKLEEFTTCDIVVGDHAHHGEKAVTVQKVPGSNTIDGIPSNLATPTRAISPISVMATPIGTQLTFENVTSRKKEYPPSARLGREFKNKLDFDLEESPEKVNENPGLTQKNGHISSGDTPNGPMFRVPAPPTQRSVPVQKTVKRELFMKEVPLRRVAAGKASEEVNASKTGVSISARRCSVIRGRPSYGTPQLKQDHLAKNGVKNGAPIRTSQTATHHPLRNSETPLRQVTKCDPDEVCKCKYHVEERKKMRQAKEVRAPWRF